MPLDSAYSYITLDSFTATVNPTEYLDPRADKKFVPVVTLTKTITQHWQILGTDKIIWMRWANLSKTDKDALKTLYEADYSDYVFTDVYGDSYDVIIINFQARRRTTIDSDGFEVEMTLQVA